MGLQPIFNMMFTRLSRGIWLHSVMVEDTVDWGNDEEARKVINDLITIEKGYVLTKTILLCLFFARSEN